MAYAILIMLAELEGIDLEDLAQTRPRRISTGPMPS